MNNVLSCIALGAHHLGGFAGGHSMLYKINHYSFTRPLITLRHASQNFYLNKCWILVITNWRDTKIMAESMNHEELTCCEERGETNTFLLTARLLKSPQVCGRLKTILVKLAVKHLHNVTHFTHIKNTIV